MSHSASRSRPLAAASAHAKHATTYVLANRSSPTLLSTTGVQDFRRSAHAMTRRPVRRLAQRRSSSDYHRLVDSPPAHSLGERHDSLRIAESAGAEEPMSQ